ncbi:TIGR03086 family metal-binding protein [Streptomyces sp. NRRL F-5053]|uniref:TIGR03086 family metal-binding protein n=1 Tax=Streptomyces sp. NRRL F-5053 TaxID=1463854 RepID=UPI0004C94872|nr:TIGR03086 family metal-binding protein [Streptomyces sp. NRRL F-5053]
MNAAPQTPDPRPALARATEQLAELLDGLRPGQLDAPTPCAEFDVRALLGHVTGVADRFANLGEGGSVVGPGVPEWAAGLPAGDWPDTYRRARERLLAAWRDDARLEAVVTAPWGTVPGRIALSGCVMETVVHGWDLARALGRDPGLDPEPAALALATAERAVPAGSRAHIPFDEARPVPADAGVHERLAAWLGRDPRWTPGTAGRGTGTA